jgi:hypothetical protein
LVARHEKISFTDYLVKSIFQYIRTYAAATNKVLLLLVTLFTAVLVYCNYHYHMDRQIGSMDNLLLRFGARYIVSLAAFAVPYLLTHVFTRKDLFADPLFIVLLIIAPAIFALKMELSFNFFLADEAIANRYWNRVVYWPLLLLITTILIACCWWRAGPKESFYGVTTRNLHIGPYLIMLAIMVPLIAAASTQPDFLAAYPKLRAVAGSTTDLLPLWKKVLFELSYGSDFFTIELFFRGFLVLAFVRFAGKDAILPMACFYCTIHFGKPLAECVSSFFGGLLLGIVVYHTRSIFGGLMVHLGIAWMMEIGGYLGGK